MCDGQGLRGDGLRFLLHNDPGGCTVVRNTHVRAVVPK